MNCKPGDLAIVVGIDVTRRLRPDVIGTIVRCVRPYMSLSSGMPCWEVDPPFVVNGFHAGMYDEGLLPIGNPGEDAQDETLQWLPVPSQHKEHA